MVDLIFTLPAFPPAPGTPNGDLVRAALKGFYAAMQFALGYGPLGG